MLNSIYQFLGAIFFWSGAVAIFFVAWDRTARYLVNKYRDYDNKTVALITYQLSEKVENKSCKCVTCVHRETCKSLPDEFDTCTDYFNLRR